MVLFGFGFAACEPVAPVVLDLTVTTAADGGDAVPGDGVCEATSSAGDCTLRAAITESNHMDGFDVITIAPGLDPVLSVAGAAEDANVTGDLDVLGVVVIEGGGATVDAAGLDRVFDVRSGALTIRDLAITGGHPPTGDEPGTLDSGTGSGVRSKGKLALERVSVVDNTVNLNSPGGAVASSLSSVRMVDTEISGNAESTVVLLRRSTLGLSRSTIITSPDGLGIFSRGAGGLVITDSTIIGGGRALYLNGGSTAVVARSTLATTGDRLIDIGAAEPTRPNPLFVGGSILDAPSSGSTPMCSTSETVTSSGWNVAADESCGLTAVGDHQGEPGLVLAIADNGGPTRTALLVPGSPAIDRIPPGTPSLCDGAPDQRGVARPQGGACDAGAVEGVGEEVSNPPVSFTVDTATDGVDATPGDGTCASIAGSCTLRAAVMEANARNGASTDLDHTITIATGIDPVLSIPGVSEDAAATGDLDVLKPLTVEGGGATVDGSGLDRVFDVAGSSLRIHHMTVTGGAADGVGFDMDGAGIRGGLNSTIVVERTTVLANTAARAGGGISSVGALTVVDSDIVANQATQGGGIESSGPNLTIERSLLRNNSAVNVGGALVTSGVNAVIADSTLSGNTAADGAAVFAIGLGNPLPVSVLRSTVVGNVGSSALTVGGEQCGLHGCIHFYMIHAESSIVVAPPGSIACSGEFSGTVSTLGNLAPDGSCGATLAGDPLLGPLVDAGGSTLVHVPASGSPAIDAISPESLSSCQGEIVDQRGISRPQGSGCDVGAVEQ